MRVATSKGGRQKNKSLEADRRTEADLLFPIWLITSSNAVSWQVCPTDDTPEIEAFKSERHSVQQNGCVVCTYGRSQHYTGSLQGIVGILSNEFCLGPLNRRNLISKLVPGPDFSKREPQQFGMISLRIMALASSRGDIARNSATSVSSSQSSGREPRSSLGVFPTCLAFFSQS